MKIKQAIRYLRISTDRQSNFSIDGQDMQTKAWCEREGVEIIDTFIDEGYSARNFDRPDMKRLNKFIEQHYRTTDYLVVNAFDRFSREAGEAIVAIKKLQKKFAVKVVSVSEGVTFDADDPGSFFYAGLMLLKGEDEIIRNRGRINLGIYTAKKKEGRYLGAAPIGYKNSRDHNNKPIIQIDEARAPMIRYIFQAFINNMPLLEIEKRAKEMGLTYCGHGSINKILKCYAYTGLLHVNAYKEHPEELVEGIHQAIIDRTTWNEVQLRLTGKGRAPRQIVNDIMPLRSVLLCHCGHPLTGAASRGRHGGLFYYYKCREQKHNNISIKKAHAQLEEILKHMSIPQDIIYHIYVASEAEMKKRLEEKSKTLKIKKSELDHAETKLISVEEKWINNQISFETYQRWHSELNQQRMSLHTQIDRLSQDEAATWNLLQKNLDKLGDLLGVYNGMNTLEKQQLIRLGFNSRLYYKDGSYRTPFIMDIFSHNTLILKQKKLILLDEEKGFPSEIPSGGARRHEIEPSLYSLLTFLDTIKSA